MGVDSVGEEISHKRHVHVYRGVVAVWARARDEMAKMRFSAGHDKRAVSPHHPTDHLTTKERCSLKHSACVPTPVPVHIA